MNEYENITVSKSHIDEIYDYRMAYNAMIFNQFHSGGVYGVHKSLRHSDGELCFGGGWFVVAAQLPTGQVTNHYPIESWEYFKVEERDTAAPYDGHSPQEALNRLKSFITECM